MATAFEFILRIICAAENRRLCLNRPHRIPTWEQFVFFPPVYSFVTSKLKWHCFSCAVINGLTPPYPRCHPKVVLTLISRLYTSSAIITPCHCPAPVCFIVIKENVRVVTRRALIGYHCKDVWCGYVNHDAWKPRSERFGEQKPNFWVKITAPNNASG